MGTSFGKVSLSPADPEPDCGGPRLIASAAGPTRLKGPAVAWITPEDSRCICLFEPSRDEDVKQLNDEANFRIRGSSKHSI
jgi:hypothetical protein